MNQQASGTRLAAILWFVAAGLAFIAFGLSFVKDSGRNWSVGIGGLFCMTMGIATWSKYKSQSPSG